MSNGVMLTRQRIDAMTAAGLWRDETILDYLAIAEREYPDQAVITDYNSESQRETTLTYRNLIRYSRRIAGALKSAGIGRGDVVAFQLPNWWQFVAIHVACVRLGAISNPLMPIFRERELKFMLSFAETKAFFVPQSFRGFDYPAMVDALRADLPTLQHVFVVNGESFDHAIMGRRWEDDYSQEALEADALAPNDLAELCYTSGTTGQPKGVLHTYNTLVACLGPATSSLAIGPELVSLMASPLAHQTGFLYGMLLPIAVGGRTVFQDIWDPAKALEPMVDQGVTMTMGSTPFLADLSQSPHVDAFAPETLNTFICAGAPIPRILVQTATQRLGARIVSGWGMSENGLVTSTLPQDAPEKVFETDGVPCEGMEVRIADDEGAALGTNEVGNLQVRGAANFVGYLKRPEAYDVDEEGWFNTGDIATMDSDGYIRITSRAKDIIIRGGENVPVVEVEELLYRHQAVQDAAIVAMPDARLGERGCLFVTLKADAAFDFAELQRYLETCQLAKNYWPERLEVIAEMPRTASGKIQKFELRALAENFTVDS
ncbi:MAG: AMP-binding protein [Pseudomonadota bacterium]